MWHIIINTLSIAYLLLCVFSLVVFLRAIFRAKEIDPKSPFLKEEFPKED
jgi:hypothetical protein